MTLIISNPVIADIVWNVEQMSEDEQQQLLTRLKIERMLSKKQKPIVRAKGIKPLSMKEIDRIKHLVRRQRADK